MRSRRTRESVVSSIVLESAVATGEFTSSRERPSRESARRRAVSACASPARDELRRALLATGLEGLGHVAFGMYMSVCHGATDYVDRNLTG
jgi:hypothetical protein